MLQSIDIAKMLDHALLKPELDEAAVREGCALAAKYHAATVCVRPFDLKLAGEVLAGSDVKLCTVIGFPHGSNRTGVKVLEAEKAMDDGAVELDMVLNIGQLVSGNFDAVEQDIRAVVEAGHRRGAIVKVIFENAYLTDELKKEACRRSVAAGADFVKTSTGFASTGATIADLKLMRAACPPPMRVKAAGGVRTLETVLACRAVGCARCGTSSTEAIMEEALKREAAGTLVESEGGELGEGY